MERCHGVVGFAVTMKMSKLHEARTRAGCVRNDDDEQNGRGTLDRRRQTSITQPPLPLHRQS